MVSDLSCNVIAAMVGCNMLQSSLDIQFMTESRFPHLATAIGGIPEATRCARSSLPKHTSRASFRSESPSLPQ